MLTKFEGIGAKYIEKREEILIFKNSIKNTLLMSNPLNRKVLKMKAIY